MMKEFVTKEQARKLYFHNKEYIEKHGDLMCWQDLYKFCRKQDRLYRIFNN